MGEWGSLGHVRRFRDRVIREWHRGLGEFSRSSGGGVDR